MACIYVADRRSAKHCSGRVVCEHAGWSHGLSLAGPDFVPVLTCWARARHPCVSHLEGIGHLSPCASRHACCHSFCCAGLHAVLLMCARVKASKGSVDSCMHALLLLVSVVCLHWQHWFSFNLLTTVRSSTDVNGRQVSDTLPALLYALTVEEAC